MDCAWAPALSAGFLENGQHEEWGGGPTMQGDRQCGIFNMLHSCSVVKQFLKKKKKYRYHKSFINNKYRLGEMFKDMRIIIKTLFFPFPPAGGVCLGII